MLDALGHRYGTDPFTIVMGPDVAGAGAWSAERMAFNLACMQQAQATASQMVERINAGGGMVFPVISLGG